MTGALGLRLTQGTTLRSGLGSLKIHSRKDRVPSATGVVCLYLSTFRRWCTYTKGDNMKYHQFVMYLFGYKVIDVRWSWNTKTKDEWSAALAEMEGR
jgi:hypothetical protein